MWVLSRKSSNPIHEGSPCKLSTSQRTPPTTTTTLGIRFQSMNFVGEVRTQMSSQVYYTQTPDRLK